MEYRGVEYTVELVESATDNGGGEDNGIIEPGEAHVRWAVAGGPTGTVQGSDENAVRDAAGDAETAIDILLDGPATDPIEAAEPSGDGAGPAGHP